MFFSTLPESELPRIGDAIETPDGPEVVATAYRDAHGTYWVNRHPVEVVRRAVAENAPAWVNVPAYRRLGHPIRAWMWNPVMVVALGDPCIVLGSDKACHEVPRWCLRGCTREMC